MFISAHFVETQMAQEEERGGGACGSSSMVPMFISAHFFEDKHNGLSFGIVHSISIYSTISYQPSQYVLEK
jgi:hypothetical protein